MPTRSWGLDEILTRAQIVVVDRGPSEAEVLV